MENVDLLVAEAADIVELANFARKTFSEAYAEDVDPKQLREQLTNEMCDENFAHMLAIDRFLIARDQQAQLVGFVQIGAVNLKYGTHLMEFDASASEVRRLYVLANLQNKKIGSSLLKAALQDPIITTAKTTYITTWEANLGAQRLYQRHGFLRVGEMPELDPTGAVNGYEYILARRS